MSRPGCIKEGCGAKATCAPRLNVPAQGWPIDTHQPLAAIVEMPLCDEHFKEVADLRGIIDALGGEIREAITAATRMALRCPPDFERAWVTKVSINSEEYESFAAAHPEIGRVLP